MVEVWWQSGLYILRVIDKSAFILTWPTLFNIDPILSLFSTGLFQVWQFMLVRAHMSDVMYQLHICRHRGMAGRKASCIIQEDREEKEDAVEGSTSTKEEEEQRSGRRLAIAIKLVYVCSFVSLRVEKNACQNP